MWPASSSSWRLGCSPRSRKDSMKATSPRLLARRQRRLQLRNGLVDREARRVLPRRELLEGLEELGDDGRRGQDEDAVVDDPVPVRVRRDVGALERIGTQVEEL